MELTPEAFQWLFVGGFLGSVIKGVSKIFKGTGSALIGGAFNLFGQERANQFNLSSARELTEFNAQQAAINREFQRVQQERAIAANKAAQQRNFQFQKNMSNTAVQRQMADYRKAGLNPILAASYGGATTPSGGAPTVGGVTGSAASGAMATVENAIGPAVSTALSAHRLKEETRLMRQDVKNRRAQRDQIATQTQKTAAETRVIPWHKQQVKEQNENLRKTRQEIEAKTLQHMAGTAREMQEISESKFREKVLAEEVNSAKLTQETIRNEIEKFDLNKPALLDQMDVDESFTGMVGRRLRALLPFGQTARDLGSAAPRSTTINQIRR